MRISTGKWVVFELALPHELRVQVVTPNGVKYATITRPDEINALMCVVQRSACGRMVGLYQSDAPMRNADGSCIAVPACIIPQRAAMSFGGHDISWLAPGEVQANRLTIPVQYVSCLELLTKRSDIPADRVVDPNFDPSIYVCE